MATLNFGPLDLDIETALILMLAADAGTINRDNATSLFPSWREAKEQSDEEGAGPVVAAIVFGQPNGAVTWEAVDVYG